MTKKKQSANRKKLTVSLCVIAKNEEQFIAACLDSTRPFVDEMIVVDTGSTDRTVEIAREHGARIEYFEWCDDFAAARNYAIEKATSDWILMLDADEELLSESGPHLRRYAAQLPADHCGWAVLVENQKLHGAADEVMRHAVTRYFPRRDSIRYVGVIHEDLVDTSGTRAKGAQLAAQIRIAHYGYDQQVYTERAKDERNMRLLEAAHKRDPHDARVMFYLGQQSFVAKRYPQACQFLEKLTAIGEGTPRFWIVEAYRLWLDALIKLSDAEGMARVTARAENEGALSAVSREVLAKYELQRQQPEQALAHALAALDPSAPPGMTTPDGTGTWRTRLLLAQVYQAMDQPGDALRELEQAFADAPPRRRPVLARNAATYALATGRATEALAWVARAEETESDDIDRHEALLFLKLEALHAARAHVCSSGYDEMDQAIAAENWQAAFDAGTTLELGSTATLARMLHLSRRLRELGAPEAALRLLGRVLDVYPPSPETHWPLIQTLKDLNRIDDALMAVEVLRKLEKVEQTPMAA